MNWLLIKYHLIDWLRYIFGASAESIEDCVISRLRHKEHTSKELMKICNSQGLYVGIARFYSIMATLEDEDEVESWDDNIWVHGRLLKQRWYRLSKESMFRYE